MAFEGSMCIHTSLPQLGKMKFTNLKGKTLLIQAKVRIPYK